jgi:hypothetical protein
VLAEVPQPERQDDDSLPARLLHGMARDSADPSLGRRVIRSSGTGLPVGPPCHEQAERPPADSNEYAVDLVLVSDSSTRTVTSDSAQTRPADLPDDLLRDLNGRARARTPARRRRAPRS